MVQFTCLVPGGLESLAMSTPGSKHHHYVITPATGGSMSKLLQDFMFLAVHNSSIGDLVTQSLTHSLTDGTFTLDITE